MPGKAILAIYGPAFGGLERYLTLYFTVCTNSLVHLSWAEIPTAAKSTITHVDFSFRDILCTP
jgi:hypothetical protein